MQSVHFPIVVWFSLGSLRAISCRRQASETVLGQEGGQQQQQLGQVSGSLFVFGLQKYDEKPQQQQ